MAPTGEAPSCYLAQAEFAPDPPDLFALTFAITQHQLIPGRRITPRAFGIELHFAAGTATPARQPFHRRGHTSVIDDESFTLEPSHAFAGFAVLTFPRHRHFSLNWITGAASRKVILI